MPHVVAAADLGAAGVGVAGSDVQGVVLCEGRGIELVHEKQRGMLGLGEMECKPFGCHSKGNLTSRPTPAALTGHAREQDLGVLLVELGVAAQRRRVRAVHQTAASDGAKEGVPSAWPTGLSSPSTPHSQERQDLQAPHVLQGTKKQRGEWVP